jgi:hypothetical protein
VRVRSPTAGMRLPLATAALINIAAAQYPYQAWMGDHWEVLSERTLLQVTLPGSHNSGNTASQLGTSPRCAADDGHYRSYLQHHDVVTREAFDEAFLPWNVNHDHNISEQLQMGVRFFHLKLCWVDTTSAPLQLSAVRHQHRGFTAAAADEIFSTMAAVLNAHPRETLVIGLNNLNGFNTAAKVRLSALIADTFAQAGIGAVDPTSLRTATLAQLAASSPSKRAVIFLGGVPATQVSERSPFDTGCLPLNYSDNPGVNSVSYRGAAAAGRRLRQHRHAD